MIDNIIKSHSHVPLRTPPYMCELNPIEMVWAQIKYFVKNRNVSGELGMGILKELIQEAIASVTPSDWEKYCKHVIDIENKYWESDYMMEEVEPLIIPLGAEESDSENDSDTEDEDTDDNSTEL